MISAPLAMVFPLSAQVLGKRLVICLGSLFMCLWLCVCVLNRSCYPSARVRFVGYAEPVEAK
jgi:hypothetical protein